MKNNAKLYIIVRNDISPGAQLAQTNHVSFRFFQEFPEITQEWLAISEYIAILQVPDEDALKALEYQASKLHIRAASFTEPDMQNELTAICLEPGKITKKLCSKATLALQ